MLDKIGHLAMSCKLPKVVHLHISQADLSALTLTVPVTAIDAL